MVRLYRTFSMNLLEPQQHKASKVWRGLSQEFRVVRLGGSTVVVKWAGIGDLSVSKCVWFVQCVCWCWCVRPLCPAELAVHVCVCVCVCARVCVCVCV